MSSFVELTWNYCDKFELKKDSEFTISQLDRIKSKYWSLLVVDFVTVDHVYGLR